MNAPKGYVWVVDGGVTMLCRMPNKDEFRGACVAIIRDSLNGWTAYTNPQDRYKGVRVSTYKPDAQQFIIDTLFPEETHDKSAD